MSKVINNLTWKIGGEAGYGIMSAGSIFAKICSRGGLNIYGSNEFPSLIRGGHNTFQIRVSNEKLWCLNFEVDILVALNKETIDLHKNELSNNAYIIYDADFKVDKKRLNKKMNLIPVPLKKIAEEEGEAMVMRNTVSLGASVALLDYDFDILKKVIREQFNKKNEDIINKNIKVAKRGYDYIKENFKKNCEYKLEKINNKEKKIILTGNIGVALGALKAGCKFVAAYPMTPSTSILQYIEKYERDFDVVVKQAEDEIAAVNMVIGAGFTGVRNLVCTSGGGFCLMTEGLGLASMSETPIVMVNCQRPGPATGLPTKTGQEDLRFMIHAAQGEGSRVVLAPGDQEECFYKTIEAFNVAEKFQLPVIILSDKYLAETGISYPKFDTKNIKIDRGKILTDAQLMKIKKYNRYAFTKDGISDRSIPGQKNGLFLGNGNEHGENGRLSEDPFVRIKMVDKRWKKLDGVNNYVKEKLKFYGGEKNKNVIVSFGSSKGAILEAIELLKKEKVGMSFLQIIYLNPFPTKEVMNYLKDKKIIVVEGNKTSQLGGLIKENCCLEIDHKILKYNGVPFFPTEIKNLIKEVLKGRKEVVATLYN